MLVFPDLLVIDLTEEIAAFQDKFPVTQRDLYEVTAQVMDDAWLSEWPVLNKPLLLITKNVPDIGYHFELGATADEQNQLQSAFSDYRQGVVNRLVSLGIEKQLEHDGEIRYGLISMVKNSIVLRYLR